MKNKFTIFTFFIGILISILGTFFISNFAFSADLKDDIQKGLIKSTPKPIQQNSDFNTVVSNVVGTALSLVAVIFFVLIVYGGFLWMTASGNDEQAKKGRDVVIASAIGVIIILSSYTLVQFIFTTVEGGGSSGPEKINTCKEYNPDWDCMKIDNCSYTDPNTGEISKGLTLEQCTDENNCVRNKCMADGLDQDVNTVCCLPYKSLCELNYPGYKCVSDENKCTSAVVNEPADLCNETNDGGTFCCDSRNVWGYGDKTKYYSDPGREGQIEEFNCVSTTGFIDPTSINFSNSVWDKQSVSVNIRASNLGKYQFNSEEECQSYGETEKVFCLKYSRGDEKYYCAELLKNESTRDCAFTSSRLFNSTGGSEVNEISCIEYLESYNN